VCVCVCVCVFGPLRHATDPRGRVARGSAGLRQARRPDPHSGPSARLTIARQPARPSLWAPHCHPHVPLMPARAGSLVSIALPSRRATVFNPVTSSPRVFQDGLINIEVESVKPGGPVQGRVLNQAFLYPRKARAAQGSARTTALGRCPALLCSAARLESAAPAIRAPRCTFVRLPPRQPPNASNDQHSPPFLFSTSTLISSSFRNLFPPSRHHPPLRRCTWWA
jgi:hypothetical protein